MTQEEDRGLKVKLSEDLGSDEAARQFLPLARQLHDLPAPQPTSEQSARLAAQMSAAFQTGQAIRAENLETLSIFSRVFSSLPWLLLRSQARLVQTGLWIVSPLVMLLGIGIAWVSYPGDHGLPLTLVAPLVAAVGMALIYGSGNEQAVEIELAAPIPAWGLLLARMALVFAFNLGLGLVASAVLSLSHSGLSFWPLVIAWLAPMAFLSGLSFFVTVLWNNSSIGVSLALGFWILLNLLRSQALRAFPLSEVAVRVFSTQAAPWLVALALGLCALALRLASNEERWLRSL